MKLVELTESCLLQIDKMYNDGEIIFMFTHLNDPRDNEDKQVMFEMSADYGDCYQLYFWTNEEGDTPMDLDDEGYVKVIGVDDI